MKDCVVEERLNNKSLYDLKKDIEPIIKSFLADTDLTVSNVTSAYLNLDCLMRTRCHVDYNKLYLFSDDKLIAQINFNPREIGIPVVIERAQYKIQENIERFVYETHGEGYHILAERLKDDESTQSALEFFNNLNVDFTKSVTKPLSKNNDLPTMPKEY